METMLVVDSVHALDLIPLLPVNCRSNIWLMVFSGEQHPLNSEKWQVLMLRHYWSCSCIHWKAERYVLSQLPYTLQFFYWPWWQRIQDKIATLQWQLCFEILYCALSHITSQSLVPSKICARDRDPFIFSNSKTVIIAWDRCVAASYVPSDLIQPL